VEAEAPRSESGHVVEAGRRLSESMLWHLQRDLYDMQGIHAWSRGNVPQSITTSPYIARAYARIAVGYLRDLASQLDRSEPVYIVELGAGSGRFGYRFVKHLSRLLQRSSLRDIPFTYVMTDISPALMDFWQNHPSLQPLVATRHLDFAHFNAMELGDIHLVNANTKLRPRNPMLLIGNYFFDSIPHDSFSIQEHALFENMVRLVSAEPTPTLKDLNVSFEARPAHFEYYREPELNTVLDGYRQRLDNAMILIPVAGLACLRHFGDLSNNRALVLLGDIGSARESDFSEYTSGGISDDGNFWLSVNFHAVGEYILQLGGSVFHPPQRHAHLNVSAFVLGSPAQTVPETALAYDEAIGQLGPDDFFVLSTVIASQLESIKRGELLAFLRSSGWDSDFFLQCLPFVLDSLQEVSWTGREDVRHAVAEIWEMYYPLGDTSDAADLPSGLGVLLYTIGDYAEAIRYFQRSLDLVAVDPRTTFNIALCLNRLGRQAEAGDWLARTLELDPRHTQALALQAEIGQPRA
jgi:tetratricopeptide (TPR) repeat protein